MEKDFTEKKVLELPQTESLTDDGIKVRLLEAGFNLALPIQSGHDAITGNLVFIQPMA